MVKILSQSGMSVSDVYDVEGSIVGIDQLLAQDGISLVHDMAATVFSERFSIAIRRASIIGMLENVDFDVLINDLPSTPTRLLNVTVVATNAARILQVAVLARDPRTGREVPVWVWDATSSLTVRMDENAGGVGDKALLLGAAATQFVPNFVGGSGQPQRVEELVLRGVTAGFGAGTVNVQGLYAIAFSRVAGISSRGLPVPSW